jgi:hypothetical protein
VDGVHFNIRLEDDRLCTLVMIGARLNGEKELLAVEDGYRESAESWKALLRDLKRRAGWPRRQWRWATARWGFGPQCARCGRRPASRPAGVASSQTCSTSCPNGFSPAPSARCTK